MDPEKWNFIVITNHFNMVTGERALYSDYQALLHGTYKPASQFMFRANDMSRLA